MEYSESARKKHHEAMLELVTTLGFSETNDSCHYIHKKSGIKLDLSATAFNPAVIIDKLVEGAIEEGKNQARIEIRRAIAME